jgi:sec-independent protein translocase protein TatA
MGSLSIWHWIIVLAVGLLLFGGRGKISDLMGDFAKGIKAFKKGMADDDKPEDTPKADPKTIDHQPAVAGDMKARAETEKKFEGGTV